MSVVSSIDSNFRGVKFVIGHMGEMIPSHLWRVDVICRTEQFKNSRHLYSININFRLFKRWTSVISACAKFRGNPINRFNRMYTAQLAQENSGGGEVDANGCVISVCLSWVHDPEISEMRYRGIS